MRKCFAASQIVRSPPFTDRQRNQILGLIGAMAEAVIGTDYLANEVKHPAWWPVPPKMDFHDANVGFASKRQYLSFIFDHNPNVDRAKAERLATERAIKGPDGQLLFIPDFMSQDAPQKQRFYEVKPDSTDGTIEAGKKIASIDAFMHDLNLPYKPGETWRPNRDFPFFTGLVFGTFVTVSFHYERHKTIQGVVVYHFCITTRTIIPVALLLLILAIIIIVILFPEIPFPEPIPLPQPRPQPIPIPWPSPIPVPVPAFEGKGLGGMNISAPPPILGSVGAGGRNDAADVRIVQLFLNTWMAACKRPLLMIDGSAGPLTSEAILSFQREYLPQTADGRIDPGGPTIQALAMLSLKDIIRHAQPGMSRYYLSSLTQFMPGEELMALLYGMAREAH